MLKKFPLVEDWIHTEYWFYFIGRDTEQLLVLTGFKYQSHKLTTKSFLRYLYSRCVYIKLPEDGKCLLKELITDSYIGYVWSIIVIQAIDVFHDTGAISLNSCKN